MYNATESGENLREWSTQGPACAVAVGGNDFIATTLQRNIDKLDTQQQTKLIVCRYGNSLGRNSQTRLGKQNAYVFYLK